MSLTKYKYALLAAAGAECETPNGIKKLMGFQNTVLVMGSMGEDNEEDKLAYLPEEITPIMRHLDQMTEEEKQDQANLFFIGETTTSFEEAVWLAGIGIWAWDEDFENGIKKKEIKQ